MKRLLLFSLFLLFLGIGGGITTANDTPRVAIKSTDRVTLFRAGLVADTAHRRFFIGGTLNEQPAIIVTDLWGQKQYALLVGEGRFNYSAELNQLLFDSTSGNLQRVNPDNGKVINSSPVAGFRGHNDIKLTTRAAPQYDPQRGQIYIFRANTIEAYAADTLHHIGSHSYKVSYQGYCPQQTCLSSIEDALYNPLTHHLHLVFLDYATTGWYSLALLTHDVRTGKEIGERLDLAGGYKLIPFGRSLIVGTSNKHQFTDYWRVENGKVVAKPNGDKLNQGYGFALDTKRGQLLEIGNIYNYQTETFHERLLTRNAWTLTSVSTEPLSPAFSLIGLRGPLTYIAETDSLYFMKRGSNGDSVELVVVPMSKIR